MQTVAIHTQGVCSYFTFLAKQFGNEHTSKPHVATQKYTGPLTVVVKLSRQQ